MNETGPAPRHCGWVFIATLLLAGLLLLAIILPWQERNEFYDQAIEQRGEQLRRYAAIAATAPALEQRLAALRDNRQTDAYYFDATDASVGGVALQRRVEAFMRTAGVTLTSAQILPPEEQASAFKLGLRLRFAGSTDGLWRLLYEIEVSQPLMIVSALNVRAMRQSPRGPRSPATDANPELNVNMDVYGYIRRTHT